MKAPIIGIVSKNLTVEDFLDGSGKEFVIQ